jgi:hypothetical protein
MTTLSLTVKFAVVGIALSATAVPAVADNAIQAMRQKLVFIQVNDDDRGSGFIASKDGYIVTSTHLFDAFAQQNLGSLKISVSGDSLQNRKAFVVESRPNLGVVLLKVPSAALEYPFVKLGPTQGLLPGITHLMLSGFAKGQTVPQNVPADLTSQDGSNERTWVASPKVEPGLIGGPVFRPEDGKVVGIIDSVVGNTTEFVPIDLANFVLLPLQLSTVSDQLLPENLDKHVNDTISQFFAREEGKTMLANWLKAHLATPHGEGDMEEYFKRNATKIESQLNSRAQHFVNYSYNDTFQLSTQAGAKSHEMPFYKADGDRGELICSAKYPASSEADKNEIFYRFNDTPIQPFSQSATQQGNFLTIDVALPMENRRLYDSQHPAKRQLPYQLLYFALKDEPPMSSSIIVQCTLLIIGSSKYD